MAITAVGIAGVLGWKLDDEKTYAIVGLKTATSELPIAIKERDLWNVIAGLIDATGAFPLAKGLTEKKVTMLTPNWYEVGKTNARDEYSLTAFFPNKGHLTLRMNRQIAEQLLESLDLALHGEDGGRPRGKARS